MHKIQFDSASNSDQAGLEYHHKWPLDIDWNQNIKTEKTVNRSYVTMQLQKYSLKKKGLYGIWTHDQGGVSQGGKGDGSPLS